MKRVFKHMIIGLILSVILFVALVIFANSNNIWTFKEGFIILFFGVIFGTIGYTLVKLWHDWYSSHTIRFTRHPFQLFIVTYITDPILGIIGFNVLGYYLMSKIEPLNNLFSKFLSK